jgi:probable rRNA maturation factor
MASSDVILRTLTLHNRQRRRALDRPMLRRVARTLLEELLQKTQYDLSLYFVAAPEMTRLNQGFLRHAGSTDVITFDYSDGGTGSFIHGEIFICTDEAALNARRFGTTWRAEIVRYLVHGVLHLCGHDDKRATARKSMKREEDRLVHTLSRRFDH